MPPATAARPALGTILNTLYAAMVLRYDDNPVAMVT
jgi:hypothetical protein